MRRCLVLLCALVLVSGCALAAVDGINGESVPAGFARIDAYRMGVLGDAERRIKRFP